jgi:pimeloyl-ACP methyl ester carboxylesterase
LILLNRARTAPARAPLCDDPGVTGFPAGSPMPTPPIVLVHGAWAGAWCWRRVLAPLRAAGHEVHAVTLTGVGERAHLLSPAVTLATHVADVVGLVTAEELRDVVLVGHSYGGMVTTGAADTLQRDAPGTLRQLVYVDAVVPLPGESWASGHSVETVTARVTAAEAAGGVGMPPPDPAAFGLRGEDRDWVLRRQTPQPYAVYREPLHFDAARVAALPRAFVDCTQPPLPTIDLMRRRVREQAGWRVVELPTGHDPMISLPHEFVGVLFGCIAAVADVR